MRVALTDDQFAEQLASFQQSAFRLEVKPAYSVDGERDMYAKFLTGGQPDIDGNRYYLDWLDSIAAKTAAGISLTRVRITDMPLTEYQRFLQWSDTLNRSVGEVIHYINRNKALVAGLPARPTDPDFWLFDDARLVVITHNPEGHRVRAELVTDDEPVKQARLWRELATTTARKETQ